MLQHIPAINTTVFAAGIAFLAFGFVTHRYRAPKIRLHLMLTQTGSQSPHVIQRGLLRVFRLALGTRVVRE